MKRSTSAWLYAAAFHVLNLILREVFFLVQQVFSTLTVNNQQMALLPL